VRDQFVMRLATVEVRYLLLLYATSSSRGRHGIPTAVGDACAVPDRAKRPSRRPNRWLTAVPTGCYPSSLA